MAIPPGVVCWVRWYILLRLLVLVISSISLPNGGNDVPTDGLSSGLTGGYDPVAMQQYYQQYYQRVAGMQGGDATANSSAAALAAQTVPGMVPVATDQGSGMMMDPNQAAALAVQQQQAAAHAAYYAHYAAAAAAQQPQWAAQAAGVPQVWKLNVICMVFSGLKGGLDSKGQLSPFYASVSLELDLRHDGRSSARQQWRCLRICRAA